MLDTVVCVIHDGMIYMPNLRPNYGTMMAQSSIQSSRWGGIIHLGYIVFPLSMIANKWLSGSPPSAQLPDKPCAVIIDRDAQVYLLYNSASSHDDKEWMVLAVPTKGCIGHRYVFSNNPSAQLAVDAVISMGVPPINAFDILSLYVYFPSRQVSIYKLQEIAKLLADCMNEVSTPQEAFPVVAGLLEYKPLS